MLESVSMLRGRLKIFTDNTMQKSLHVTFLGHVTAEISPQINKKSNLGYSKVSRLANLHFVEVFMENSGSHKPSKGNIGVHLAKFDYF